jgi:chemotaxis-related protein WspB
VRAFVFIADGARYAVDAACVEAVHPLVRARHVPGAPPWLAGVIDVHGEFVPLVDAVALMRGSGSVALAVDRVLDAATLDDDGAWRAGAGTVAWLGSVVQHAGHAVQRFEPASLAEAHRQLAAPAAVHAPGKALP